MERRHNSRKLSGDSVVFCPDTSSEEGIVNDKYPRSKGCFIGCLFLRLKTVVGRKSLFVPVTQIFIYLFYF